MNNLQQIALELISKSPQVNRNPMASEYLDIIRNNDSVRGQQIAENLCRSYGTTKEQAVNDARRFFRF